MKLQIILGSLAVMLMFASCKKDDNNTNATAIEGTYKLKYLNATTNSTVIADDGEKTVTTSEYTTMNNQGTLVFDKSNLSYTGLSYSIDTEAQYYFYQGDVLEDSFSAPITFTLPATNGMGTYKLVGSDSIYFPQGSVTSGTSTTQGLPSGGRYNFNGNVLTIKQHVSTTSTEVDPGSGISLTTTNSGITNTVLEKQ